MEIKQKFNEEIQNLIDQYLLVRSKKFSSNFYVGKVIDNNDSDKKGRCKILIYGKYDGIPETDLPWAIPDFGLNGEFVVPDIGSIVNVYFKNNDLYCPFYTSKVIHNDDLSEERNNDYPNSIVLFETAPGDFLVINKKTNETVWQFASGASINVDGKGNINIETIGTSVGKINITGLGKITLDAPQIQLPNGNVIPTGRGPLLALHYDTMTGLPMSGNLETRMG